MGWLHYGEVEVGKLLARDVRGGVIPMPSIVPLRNRADAWAMLPDTGNPELTFPSGRSGHIGSASGVQKTGTIVGIVLREGENVTAMGFLREHRRGTRACPEGHQ